MGLFGSSASVARIIFPLLSTGLGVGGSLVFCTVLSMACIHWVYYYPRLSKAAKAEMDAEEAALKAAVVAATAIEPLGPIRLSPSEEPTHHAEAPGPAPASTSEEPTPYGEPRPEGLTAMAAHVAGLGLDPHFTTRAGYSALLQGVAVDAPNVQRLSRGSAEDTEAAAGDAGVSKWHQTLRESISGDTGGRPRLSSSLPSRRSIGGRLQPSALSRGSIGGRDIGRRSLVETVFFPTSNMFDHDIPLADLAEDARESIFELAASVGGSVDPF